VVPSAETQFGKSLRDLTSHSRRCSRDGSHQDSPFPTPATIVTSPYSHTKPSAIIDTYVHWSTKASHAMHPHPRPSPRTASAANNLQTNPTRTNNQREPTSERSSPYSDTASYTDRGPDDGDGEMVTRAEQMSEMEQRNYQKVNQVIQVRTVAHASQAMSDANSPSRTFSPKQHSPSSPPGSCYPRASPRTETSDKTNGYVSISRF
jgi:hypothetical protein